MATVLGESATKAAKKTAATFHEEFPGELPSRSWLAEASSIERISDKRREQWFELVVTEVVAMNAAPKEPRR